MLYMPRRAGLVDFFYCNSCKIAKKEKKKLFSTEQDRVKYVMKWMELEKIFVREPQKTHFYFTNLQIVFTMGSILYNIGNTRKHLFLTRNKMITYCN